MNASNQAYTINPRHDILYVDLFGSWNHEQTYQFSLDYKKQVSRYFAREWVCVLNLKKLDMLISESEQIGTFKSLLSWSYLKGMTALVAVVGIENRHYLLYQFEEILNSNQPYGQVICYSDAEVRQWLIKHQKLIAGSVPDSGVQQQRA